MEEDDEKREGIMGGVWCEGLGVRGRESMNRSYQILGVLLTGIMGIIVYPTVIWGVHVPDCGYLAWFYLIPLFVVITGQTIGRTFCLSFLASFLFYFGSLYWLMMAMHQFGDIDLVESAGILSLVVIILSFFFSMALVLANWVHQKIRIPLFILYAVFLLSFDYLRTTIPVEGFPWPMTAYSQGKYLVYFQWVELTGVFGLSLFIFLINGLLTEMTFVFLKKGTKDLLVNRGILLVLLILASFFLNSWRQSKITLRPKDLQHSQLALIQGNIPQDTKWDVLMARSNMNRYLTFSEQAASRGVDLAIWPESAYPYTIDLDSLNTLPIFNRMELPLNILFGAVSQKYNENIEKPLIYNSAFLVRKDQKMSNPYHKRHLVPFGEYVPMKKELKFARRLTEAVGDFTAGTEPSIIEYGALHMGILICYEDIFSDLARDVVREGANILINLTNDAWYGNTSAQYQHLVYSQFRALENRLYLVRATNTGVTAVIDSRGVVIDSMQPFTAGILIAQVILENKESFYTQYGDYVAWLCIVLCSLFLVSRAWRVVRRA